MADESVDVVVIGAGQAGIATSEHLRRHGIGIPFHQLARPKQNIILATQARQSTI